MTHYPPAGFLDIPRSGAYDEGADGGWGLSRRVSTMAGEMAWVYRLGGQVRYYEGKYRKIPGARFVTLADRGRRPQFEKSEEHDEILTRFLLGRD
jgi:hypothetical protein